MPGKRELLLIKNGTAKLYQAVQSECQFFKVTRKTNSPRLPLGISIGFQNSHL